LAYRGCFSALLHPSAATTTAHRTAATACLLTPYFITLLYLCHFFFFFFADRSVQDIRVGVRMVLWINIVYSLLKLTGGAVTAVELASAYRRTGGGGAGVAWRRSGDRGVERGVVTAGDHVNAGGVRRIA
jgi:hypothetical protein